MEFHNYKAPVQVSSPIAVRTPISGTELGTGSAEMNSSLEAPTVGWVGGPLRCIIDFNLMEH